MKAVGIIKEIDNTGRILIPKELREQFGLSGRVEVIATEVGIVIRSQEYELIKIQNTENPPKITL